MPALLAMMEVPAIVIGIYFGRRSLGMVGGDGMGKLMHELLTGKGIVLLVGGIAIGMLSGEKGYKQVAPFFEAPFPGILTLFLLEAGLVTGRRLGDLRAAGPFLAGFAVVMPCLHGIVGTALGHFAGLGVGGSTLLGVLAASASYIAAPAAVRVGLPQANPAYYLTAALAVTFPFNVVVGLPLYYWVARQIAG
jgi:hypothetical protein